MAKRRTQSSDDYYPETTDDPIGLTSAFEVVKDPQAVKYDVGDQAIGLTEAFARVGQPEQRAWDDAGKWDGFDWEAGWQDGSPERERTPIADEATSEAFEAHDESGQVGQEGDSAAAVQPGGAQRAVEGGVAAPTYYSEEPRQIDVAKDLAHASAAVASSKATRHGRHAAHSPHASEAMRKSHRVRKVLIFVVILLLAALSALGYFVYQTLSEGQEEAKHQVQEKIEAPKETETETEGDDTVETAAELANVPNLTGLLGKTTDEAIVELGRGAVVSSNQKVKEKGSAIKNNVTIALADEPADSKTGTPSVYLGLDKGGKIIQVGYSAAASALGFGSLSFADAVNSEHVIERTLGKIGVEVEDGSATLPDDRSKYATYASDKTTVVKERCSFEGDVEVNGVPCTWSAVLSYDYTTQVITGNLSDTVRIIYVYITQK